MKKPKKTRSEMETLIRKAADESSWDVFSEDPAVVRKLTRLHGAGKPWGAGFRWMIKVNLLTFRKPGGRRKGNSEALKAARSQKPVV